MPYTYAIITAEQRRKMTEARMIQLEGEHFSHQLNKMAFSSLAPSKEKDDAISAANEAQATIEAAISVFAATVIDDDLTVEPS